MPYPKRMLVENRAWSLEQSTRDPGFFNRLAARQAPRVLWIGCSDSRVPAERITNASSGTLFVHRNIANLFTSDDGNTSSVLEYAVGVLKVEHIIVCGHHGCGGVRAALGPTLDDMPALDRRIAGIRDVAQRHRQELDAIDDLQARVDRLAELNVVEQTERLRNCPAVRGAGSPPLLHGWMFDLGTGLLRQVIEPTRPRAH